MARTVRKKKLSRGMRKMRWSITQRIGRRQTALITSGSTKETWLQTTTAAPSSGMCSTPDVRTRYTEWTRIHTMKRIRNSGTRVKM
jgi:hypothetical protein